MSSNFYETQWNQNDLSWNKSFITIYSCNVLYLFPKLFCVTENSCLDGEKIPFVLS